MLPDRSFRNYPTFYWTGYSRYMDDYRHLVLALSKFGHLIDGGKATKSYGQKSFPTTLPYLRNLVIDIADLAACQNAQGMFQGTSWDLNLNSPI